jgi:hypothetical protein
VDEACVTYWGEKKYKYNFGGETFGKRPHRRTELRWE